MTPDLICGLVIGFLAGELLAVFIYRLLKRMIDRRRADTTAFAARLSDWGVLATGESGWIEIEREWLRVAQDVYHIFCTKQKNYGPKNIAIGGTKGVVLRVSDKVSRLWEMTGLDGAAKDDAVGESLEDALMDTADYGIIGTLVERGKWPTMTVNDAFGRTAIIQLLNQLVGELTPEDLEYLVANDIADSLGAQAIV